MTTAKFRDFDIACCMVIKCWRESCVAEAQNTDVDVPCAALWVLLCEVVGSSRRRPGAILENFLGIFC